MSKHSNKIQAILLLVCLVSLASGCDSAPQATPTTQPAIPTRTLTQAIIPTTAPAATAEPTAIVTPLTQPDNTPTTIDTPTLEAIEPPSDSLFLRANQVGYLPGEEKIAFALSKDELSNDSFTVLAVESGEVVLTGDLSEDSGPYGNFAHFYQLDFSTLITPGKYTLKLDDALSEPFEIGTNIYRPAIPLTLDFYKVQRCGDTDPAEHAVCHLEDGVAANGPGEGETIDTTGGWHDAGDYLKFMHTTAAATLFMLTAYELHPAAFDANAAGLPNVLEEAGIGLDWMQRMWHPETGTLYYQVGDVSDHTDWRLPDGDDESRPQRMVWAVEPGKGANIAGKAAATYALASMIWGDPDLAFYDPDKAAAYLETAKQLYTFGAARPEAQSSTDGFYTELSWQDDMALAATQLYAATGEQTYRDDAHIYIDDMGEPPYALTWSELHSLAQYKLALADPEHRQASIDYLANHLYAYAQNAGTKAFGVAVDELYWGVVLALTGAAIEESFYQDLGGPDLPPVGQKQRDYMLGANPWGVCMVNSLGSVWPHHPHHQVANLKNIELRGSWGEGPAGEAQWQEQSITLSGPDPYADFQSPFAVFHDDLADYVTNEPTITANAWGLMLLSLYADTETP